MRTPLDNMEKLGACLSDDLVPATDRPDLLSPLTGIHIQSSGCQFSVLPLSEPEHLFPVCLEDIYHL